MSTISQNLISTPFDENAYIKAEALMEAAQGDSLHRVFPDQHQHYRTWAILTPHGAVTVEDHDLNWYTIVYVSMDEIHEQNFWDALQQYINERPNRTLVSDEAQVRQALQPFRDLQEELTREQVQIVKRELENGYSTLPDDTRWADTSAILAVMGLRGYEPLSHGRYDHWPYYAKTAA